MHCVQTVRVPGSHAGTYQAAVACPAEDLLPWLEGTPCGTRELADDGLLAQCTGFNGCCSNATISHWLSFMPL